LVTPPVRVFFNRLKTKDMSKPHQPSEAHTTTTYVPTSLTVDQWEQIDGIFTHYMTFEDMQCALSEMKKRYLILFLEAPITCSIDKTDILDDLTHLDLLIDIG
jgi:hypothetical protein